MDAITSVLLRKIVNDIEWTSPSRRKGVVGLLVTVFDQSLKDEIISRNPALSIPGAKVPKREIDPFTIEEANLIIAKAYEITTGLQQIYAAYLEFCFYTGMRP
jgi:integrase